METKDVSATPTEQLFPKSANPWTRWLVAATVTCAASMTVFAYFGYRSDWWQGQNRAPDQPVLFSHHHHVAELRIDCRFCHGSVETSAFAGMPATETCMTCHSGIFTDSPMLAPVVASATTGRPLRWTRVYDLPDYVYFNHSSHVTHGIGCTTCHGDIGGQRLTRKAQPLHMTWCLDCHRAPEHFVRKKEDVFSPSVPAMAPLTASERAGLARHSGFDGEHLTECTTCHR